MKLRIWLTGPGGQKISYNTITMLFENGTSTHTCVQNIYVNNIYINTTNRISYLHTYQYVLECFNV